MDFKMLASKKHLPKEVLYPEQPLYHSGPKPANLVCIEATLELYSPKLYYSILPELKRLGLCQSPWMLPLPLEEKASEKYTKNMET